VTTGSTSRTFRHTLTDPIRAQVHDLDDLPTALRDERVAGIARVKLVIFVGAGASRDAPSSLPEAVLGHDEDCRAYIAAGLDFSRRTG
jgi:hypothetical protein